MKLKAYRKFIVAAVGLAVALGLFDEGTAQEVVGAVTALLVLAVPND